MRNSYNNLLSLWIFFALDISSVDWQRSLILLGGQGWCSVLRAEVRRRHGEILGTYLFKQGRRLFHPGAITSSHNWIVVIVCVLLIWIFDISRGSIGAGLRWLWLIGHVLFKNYLRLVLSLRKNESLVRAFEQSFWGEGRRVLFIAGIHNAAVWHRWCELLRCIFLSRPKWLYHRQLSTAHHGGHIVILLWLHLPHWLRPLVIARVSGQSLSVTLRRRVGYSWKPGLHTHQLERLSANFILFLLCFISLDWAVAVSCYVFTFLREHANRLKFVGSCLFRCFSIIGFKSTGHLIDFVFLLSSDGRLIN